MSMSQDGIRVLLVEDSPSDAQLLCEALRDYPLQQFEVERVERLGEAVALLARGSFEVILLDLHLPDSRGMETCARMARAAGGVPIIVLTGANDEATAAEALRWGVQDYLVKGQSPGGVIGRTICYAVERSRTQLALRELNATLESKVAQRTQELEHRARQLQKLTLELSEAEERERQRLAELLHDDLQQVLAAAKFHVGLMKTRAKSHPAIQAAATQIDQMLKDAIEKSRSLSHELSPAVLHHGDFAETLGWLARQVQAKHGLQVRVDAFGAVRSQSDALKAFLYRAAQELLFNVVKHAGVSEARIRVRRLGRFICLSVSDRGRGFDPQEIRETAGFGLLSIRERVALLGGRMSTHSAKGRGATFHIIMPDGAPCGKEAATEQGPSRYAALDNRGRDEGDGRLRVLLVDDHEIVRQGVASLLSEEPAIRIVGEAANGREAVDLANRLRPDVVVMDVSMPVMSGDEATRLIKKELPQTRVVALSMHEQGETVETMRRAGAERYVLKTAPSEELIAAICGRQVND